ncbi:hypothetical protein VKT23_002691 [Stygiomarasmius scandens]|uniref:F-box domain-containing protein n=1 Tax=Marasmiellus scandens TaxID=2682957 RepID=A0ABR1K2R2_9AGAR
MIFVPRVSLDLNKTQLQARSREVPSAEQCLLISEYLAGAEQDLQEYNAEARRLQALVDAVTAKANQLKRLMQMKQSLLAPVRKLPDELLALIFERCSFDLFEKKEPSVMHVCSRWRNIALSFPALWSYIILNADPMMYHQIPSLKALELHLERSKTCSLTIQVTMGQGIFNHSLQLLNILAFHSHRWKRFSLYLCPDLKSEQGKLTNCFSTIPDLPLLKSFAYTSAFLQPDPRTISAILKLAVNLESLSLWHPPPDLETCFSGINVTCLEILVHCSAEIFKLVDKCPQLKHLTYVIDGCKDSILPGLVPQKSATVQSLEIKLGYLGQDAKRVFPDIIDSLDFPSLNSLKVTVSIRFSDPDFCRGTWPCKQFNEFFLRSGCKLKSFSLNDIDISDISLCQLLQSDAFSHLANLTLRCAFGVFESPVSTRFLKRLSSNALIPRLTKLLLVVSASSFDDEAFAEAVLSRCPARAPVGTPVYLRSVFLRMAQREFDPAIYIRLRDGVGSVDLQIVNGQLYT